MTYESLSVETEQWAAQIVDAVFKVRLIKDVVL
jgi:hypothetical protein